MKCHGGRILNVGIAAATGLRQAVGSSMESAVCDARGVGGNQRKDSKLLFMYGNGTGTATGLNLRMTSTALDLRVLERF